MKQTTAILGVLLMLTVSHLPQVKASTIKVVHIRNPGNSAYDDMHVTFTSKTSSTVPTRGTGSRSSYASDQFDTASGLGSATLNFANASVGFGSGSTDNFSVLLEGDTNEHNPLMVSQVVFTNGGVPKKTLLPNLLDPKDKEFEMNVAGFTNAEFFDLTNLDSVYLNLLNWLTQLNLEYTLSDLKVFTNLPRGNFNMDNYLNTGDAVPVYSAASVTIGPGVTLQIPLGGIQSNTYVLATINTLSITDLDNGNTNVFRVPQSYAQDVNHVVPEPSMILLVAVGMLGLACTSRRTVIGALQQSLPRF